MICPICLKAKTVAEQLAAKLNTKLNYQPKEEDDKAEEEQVETFRKYEEELEINDFPQQARWRVTSKVSMVFYYVLQLHFIGYVLRNTHTTGKSKDIDSDYEAREAKKSGFCDVASRFKLCFKIHFVVIYTCNQTVFSP